MLHAGVASLVDIEEFQIDKDESKLLAESIGNVAQHYSVQVDPKVMAWAGLVGVLCAIYGPKIASWRIRVALEKTDGGKVPTPVPDEDPLNAMPIAMRPFQPGNFSQH